MPKNTFPGTLTEANLAQLADENTSVLDPGVLAYVQDLDAYYRFSPTDTTPADGINVIQPNNVSLVGRWSLLITEDDIFASQPVWFIDPVNGNDENTGNSALTPLLTHDELRRRLGNSVIMIPVTVVLMGDFPKDNPVRVDFTVGFTGSFTYVGSQAPIVVAASAVVARTPADASTNQAWELTSGFDWTASDAINHSDGTVGPIGAGRRIRFLAGGSVPAGTVCWAVKDLGLNVARISPPSDTSFIYPFYTYVVPTAGDQFVVEKVFQVVNFSVDLKCDGLAGFQGATPTNPPFPPVPPGDPWVIPPITINDLSIGDLTENLAGFQTVSTSVVRNNAGGIFSSSTWQGVMVNCQCASMKALGGTLGFVSCHIAGINYEWAVQAGSATISMQACASTTRILVEGGQLALLDDFIYQQDQIFGNAIEARRGGEISFGNSFLPGRGGASFWDNTDSTGAILLTTGSQASAYHEAISGSGGRVYGACDPTGGPGINITTGCQFIYASNRQATIVGSVPGVNDVRVDGVNGPITVDMSSTNGSVYSVMTV